MPANKYQPLTLTPVNFSLTEGTEIPAPPESPDSPRPPTPGKGPLDSHPTPTSGTFPLDGSKASSEEAELRKTTSTNGNSGTLPPTSPGGTKRPGSVRKFLGLHPMSSSDSLGSERPGSPSTVGSKQGLTRKKSTSWFGRRKSSFMMGAVTEGKENTQSQQGNQNGVQQAPAKSPPRPVQKKGPPPPALPALSSFGVSDNTTSFDTDDMFKNIK